MHGLRILSVSRQLPCVSLPTGKKTPPADDTACRKSALELPLFVARLTPLSVCRCRSSFPRRRSDFAVDSELAFGKSLLLTRIDSPDTGIDRVASLPCPTRGDCSPANVSGKLSIR